VNKKMNTFLFILGATVVNIVTMLAIIIFGVWLLAKILPDNAEAGQVLFMLLFFIAIGGSFVIYHQIVKLISRKVDMDKYFHPLFKPRKK
jgi:hypothetical protein